MSFEARSWIGLAVIAAVTASVAWAEPAAEPEAPPVAAPPKADHRMRCRLFETPMEATVDTWDRSTALGQWVLDQQAQGWTLDDLELTVGRKATGFVQSYAQVCVVPRR